MVMVSKRKGTLRSLVAKLLVLGSKQTGKSASIVRYTTGRFIEEYSDSTTDLLYRHSLGFDAKRSVTTMVELLEQNDIQFCSSSNFFAGSTNNLNNNSNDGQQQQQQYSLSSRVALDQQADIEMHSKQQLLNRLHWANAYVVIYAINDISTFNKAIKYLNLIANNINSPLDNQSTATANGTGNITGNNFNFNGNVTSNGGGSTRFLNKLSPAAFGGSSTLNCLNSNSSSGSLGGGSNNCNCVGGGSSHNLGGGGNIKRPILLLGNKRDLEKGGRQVNANDGRLLAMRHQSMFAEVSIAESDKLIETVLGYLIEQIDPACLQVDHSPQQQTMVELPLLVRWSPTIELAPSQTTMPVWANIVKSQVLIGSSSLAQSSRIDAADVRLIKPVGSSLCQPVGAKAIFSPPLVTCKGLLATSESVDHQQPKLETTIKGLQLSCSKLAINNVSRYQNLKTSFRRASMAIIGSKTLAKGANVVTATVTNVAGIKLGCESLTKRQLNEMKQNYSTRDSIGECTDLTIPSPSEPHNQKLLQQQQNAPLSRYQSTASLAPSNWIKNHVKLGHRDQHNNLSSCSDLKLNFVPLDSTSSENKTPVQMIGDSSSRFKKPLFKYKSRRKTVAFEQVVKGSSLESNISLGSRTDPGSVYGNQLNETFYKVSSEDATSGTRNSSCSNYNSTRYSSNRSSSSLSTMDAYYPSAQFATWNPERAASSTGSTSVCSSNYSNNNSTGSSNQIRTLTRNNSRSTLSRASTSGGSYEESSDEVMQTLTATAPIVGTTTGSMNNWFGLIGQLPLSVESSSAHSGSGNDTNKNHNSSNNSSNNNNHSDNKKQYQLEKSVQSTLTNLTRSTNISAQASKKSFCNGLFKNSALTNVKTTTTPLIADRAKIERIQAMPVVAGFCK